MIASLAAAAAALGCSGERHADGAGAPGVGGSRSTPATRQVVVYFSRPDSCVVQAFPRDVADGPAIDVVRATLQALLAGPTPEEISRGFGSAIPDTLEILRHRMRYVTRDYDSPHYGRRVEIQELEARPDGILYVSFSREINAYDHGAVRVCSIVRQVRETVRQFREFKDVMIAVDGRTEGVLQP